MHIKRTTAAVSLSVLGLGLMTTAATATVDNKVTICHAKPADTAKNGWVSITVAKASIMKPKGHGTSHDADIIPPFEEGKNWDAFPGKNWDTEGQAVWNSGCVLPQPSTTTTLPTETETTSATTSPTSTTTTNPSASTTASAPTTTTATTTVPVSTTRTTTEAVQPSPTTKSPTSSGTTPTRSTASATATTSSTVSATRTELAYTGFNIQLFMLGMITLLAGLACWFINLRFTKNN